MKTWKNENMQKWKNETYEKIKHHQKSPFKKGQTIVSIITGHGLKDPNRAIEISATPQLVKGSKDAILSILSPYMTTETTTR